MKKYSSILFLLILFCFFLPFVNISCSGQNVSTLSGIQLIFGDHTQADQSGESHSPDFFIVLAFACTAAGIIFALLKKVKSIIVSLIFSIIIFVSLLIFQFRSSFHSSSKEPGSSPEVHFEYGYWLALILSALTAVSFFIQLPSSKDPEGR